MTRAGQSKISRRRPLRNGVLALTLSTPALAAGVRKKPIGDAMTSELTANEIVELLNLEPNATCGFVRVTFIAKQTLAAGALPPPFERSGPLGSALYFLVTPDAPVRLHRIRNDQLYHYYLGDPLELFLLHADGRAERVVVGPDLRGGQHVQLLIPGNTVPYRASAGARSLVFGREHRMARRRSGGCGNRRSRGIGEEISCRRRRSALDRGVREGCQTVRATTAIGR